MRSRLVGRENELRLARNALRQHGVVVFAGPSGVGKTAICDVLAEEWVSRHGRVHELRGTHGLRSVPFGALTLGLRVDSQGDDAETLSRVLAKLSEHDSEVMVVADDAHLLDDQSAGLVSGLAQSQGVALALSITSGEVVSPDITSVWARWPDCRLEVDPLARDEVGEMLRAMLDDEVSEETIDEVAAVSLGYPLYVSAIASELAAGGSLGDENDLGVTSERLVSLMERRLGRLDESARDVFNAVAFAESVTPETVHGGAQSQTVERLRTSGLLRQAGGRLQVAHPLLGSVARNSLASDERRRIAERLLMGAEKSSDPGDVASVVRKAVAEGMSPPTEMVVKAAELALDSRDYEGLLRLVSVAPQDPDLAVLRARAAKFVGETAATEIPPGLDDDQLTEFLSGASQGMAYVERRFSDAIRFLGDGMASVESPANRDRLALEMMVLSGLVGDLDALLGAARAVSPQADANTRMLAISATQLAEALTLATASSDDTYESGLELADQFEIDGYLVEQLAMSRTGVLLAEGRLWEAREVADAFQERTLLGSWLTIEAVLADAWSPIEDARTLAEMAVAALEQFDPLANLAQSRIVADLRRAQMGIRPHDEDAVLREPGVQAIDDIMNRRVDAWLAWAEEDPTAGKRLVEVGRDAIALGHRFWGLLALQDAVRLGFGEDVVADVDHLVITRGAGIAVLVGLHARASSTDELWNAARAWWSAGAPTYALEAAISAAPDDPVDMAAVHLMAANGATSLVSEISAVDSPLSERQIEIVSAVLAGRTNDEIADSLFLSRRTVENHLHRVYSTLGLEDGRDALRDRLAWILEGPGKANEVPADPVE